MVTDYQLSRREQMSAYLNSLMKEAKSINGNKFVIWSASGFLTLLISKLAKRNLVLEIPDCCPNSNQEEFHIMFTWNKDEHYLECEVFNNEEVEFYYRNRVTKQDWGEDTTLTQPLCEEVIEKLSLFVE